MSGEVSPEEFKQSYHDHINEVHDFQINVIKSAHSQSQEIDSMNDYDSDSSDTSEKRDKCIEITEEDGYHKYSFHQNSPGYLFKEEQEPHSALKVEETQDVTPNKLSSSSNKSNESLQYSNTSLDKHEDFGPDYAKLSDYINKNDLMMLSLQRRKLESDFDNEFLNKEINDLKADNASYLTKIQQLIDKNTEMGQFYQSEISKI